MSQGVVVGPEIVLPAFLLMFYGLIALDNKGVHRKSVFCLFLAACTTFVFVVNWGADMVPLRNGRVESLAMVNFGMPARGFWVERELDYSHDFKVPELSQPVRLSFRCTALDSSGTYQYRLERTQRYYDLVKLKHGSLAKFLTSELERRGVASELARFVADRDSTRLEAVKRLVEEVGQPIDLRQVKKVRVKQLGGDS